MSHIGLFLLSFFISLNSSVPENIEKAFLQNNPRLLYSLFSSAQPVNISLPSPISFSDQISCEQAYFLFQKIFRTYTTFEFFPEPGALRSPEQGRYILKARWSFWNKNKNQYVFQIFFYVRSFPGGAKLGDLWKITEIKAEGLWE